MWTLRLKPLLIQEVLYKNARETSAIFKVTLPGTARRFCLYDPAELRLQPRTPLYAEDSR